MASPEIATTRIARAFAAGQWKVELEPDDVSNWHEISRLLIAKGYYHIHMNSSTTNTMNPYAINAEHRKSLSKLVIRMFRKFLVPKVT